MSQTQRRAAMFLATLLLTAIGLTTPAAPAHAATSTIAYSLEVSDQDASRVGGSAAPCAPPVGSTGFRYATALATVDVSGDYLAQDLFVGGGDAFLAIYSAPFDPEDPAANCVASIDDSNGSAPAPLVAGTTYHLFLSTYNAGSSGDFGYDVTGPGTLTVQASAAPTATTTTLLSDANPVALPSMATFTAFISGAAPTGTVELFDGAASLGTAPVVAGRATLSVALPAGRRSITAAYSGDAANEPSTSSPYQQVVTSARATTTTAVTSSANPVASPASVVLTATVTGAAPSQSVEFLDGTTSLGIATLVGGQASLSIALAPGQRSITAVYAGDASNEASTSPVYLQVVDAAPTTTTVTSAANPVTAPEQSVYTVTVTGDSPTGTVELFDHSTLVGTATLVDGTATITVATTVGSHPIEAVYSGDDRNASSTSPVLTQVVTAPAAATTSATVTSATNPVTAPGQSVLTVTVTGDAPTGTVELFDGTTSLGTVELVDGSATLSVPLQVGSHSITAVYAGDAANAASTSPVLVQVVDAAPPAATTTTVVSAANPVTAPAESAFTVTVAGAAPTGSVELFDGTTSLGTVALADGTATLTVALSVGSHSITAVYAGDAANAASSSPVLVQVVAAPAPATTITTVAASANPLTAPAQATFRVAVAGAAPTGTVELFDGTTSLGTATVVDGSATLTVTLAVGSHAITAVYSGDDQNAPSTSAALVQMVVAAVVPSEPTPVSPRPVSPAPGVAPPAHSAPNAAAVRGSAAATLPRTGADPALPAALGLLLLAAGAASMLVRSRRVESSTT